MAKDNFPKLVTPKGVARYPWLTKPDTKFNPTGDYKVDLLLTHSEAEPLVEQLTELLESYAADQKKDNPKKYSKYTLADIVHDEVDDQGEDTGNVFFRFKLKAEVKTKKGIWKRTPALYNAKLEKITVAYVGAGSIIRVRFEARPYSLDTAKQHGITLQIISVQIIELQAGSADETDGFGEEEGGFDGGSEFKEDTGFEDNSEDDNDDEESGDATDF